MATSTPVPASRGSASGTSHRSRVSIVGGGLFGLAAAAELARRGVSVSLFEATGFPGDKAASRDISKAIRLGYGAESAIYAPWVLEARDGWRALEAATNSVILHEVGWLGYARSFEPGVFEHDSYAWLAANGFPVERLDPAEARERYPALAFDDATVCTLDPTGGWLDPHAAIAAFVAVAEARGVELHPGAVVTSLAALPGDAILVCAGAWIRRILPELPLAVRTTRQHEALFRPAQPGPFARLPVWSYDLAGAGLYGFPLHPSGVVKVGCHDPGTDADPDEARTGDVTQAARIRGFVDRHLPGLRGTRDDGVSCLYTLSPDAAFLFDEVDDDAGRPVFAAGCGSGHAFKFGPLLGRWAADLVTGSAPVPPQFRLSSRSGPRVV